MPSDHPAEAVGAGTDDGGTSGGLSDVGASLAVVWRLDASP